MVNIEDEFKWSGTTNASHYANIMTCSLFAACGLKEVSDAIYNFYFVIFYTYIVRCRENGFEYVNSDADA